MKEISLNERKKESLSEYQQNRKMKKGNKWKNSEYNKTITGIIE